MTEKPRRRWGRAGERLDANGNHDTSKIQAYRAKHGGAQQTRDAELRKAYQQWRAGAVIPDRITQALDLRGLYGPEVDEACKAQEPEVDQWEAGERYPSWEQLCALADLTGFPPRFFTTPGVGPLDLWDTSLWHKMSPDQQWAYKQSWTPHVMRYSRAVLDERPPATAEFPGLPS